MVREALVALLLMLGLTHSAIPHRKRAIGRWADSYTRSKDITYLPWQGDEVSLHKYSFLELRKDIERLVRMRKSDSTKRNNGLIRRLVMLHTMMAPRMIQKRLALNCDTTRITIQTILEYLRSGRICGFRVTTVRFGLGGRR